MAVLFILMILVVGLILIATERINKMNKAAIAMFTGVLCWLLYIGYGTHFVISEHQIDFLSFLTSNNVNSYSVREFIAQSIFWRYIVSAAEVVLFILGTMTIVEVLNNNGCFDFVQEWLRTRNPQRYLWILAGFTFTLSANLDNLTTVCLMLAIMHTMIADDKQRMIFGSVIIIAANCGGAFTVIGDVTSLSLWINRLITPTTYSAVLFLPCLFSLITILFLVSRNLPRRLTLVQTAPPYRGDDTLLTRGQRLIMLVVGIGGLWFIPTFHRLTLLPPFLGTLCVLSLLWIVNEIYNRSLLSSDQMVQKRQPLALQYINIQNILFLIGLILAFGALNETGVLVDFVKWSISKLNNIYILSIIMGCLSSIFNNITAVLANITVYSQDIILTNPELERNFGANGIYWPLLSYTTAIGSSLLTIGTIAGLALMRMEGITLKWYIRYFFWKILIGGGVGFIIFYITV